VPYCFGTTPLLNFADLVLPGHVVETCNEIVREHAESTVLSSCNLKPRNRILLTGPPGNGKTSLAEALAAALQAPIYTVLYESLIESHLGETGTRLHRLFDKIAEQRCVLFFDEFDVVGKERGDAQEIGEMKRLVGSLLMLIDRLPNYVVVIAASNHAELLDRAVFRRFQVKIPLPAPCPALVEEFFRKFEQRTNTPLGVPLAELAAAVSGKLNNFAEIEEFAVSALRDCLLIRPAGGIRSAVERRLELLDHINSRQ
jgi:SpoVK/Ycf46/Vps4 family AAA+-type ATPase